MRTVCDWWLQRGQQKQWRWEIRFWGLHVRHWVHSCSEADFYQIDTILSMSIWTTVFPLICGYIYTHTDTHPIYYWDLRVVQNGFRKSIPSRGKNICKSPGAERAWRIERTNKAWLKSHRLGWLEWHSKRQRRGVERRVDLTRNETAWSDCSDSYIPLVAPTDRGRQDWPHGAPLGNPSGILWWTGLR